MTDRVVAGSDLFRRVEAHYREHFTREGRGEAFADWLARLRGELAETATHGANPAFILHVLVCTRWRRLRRPADEAEAIRRLTRRKQALLVGGLRLLRTLGEPWLAELYGPGSAERVKAFLIEVGVLEHLLTGAVLETPAWHVGPRGRMHPRAWEQAVTACLICLLDELKGHPKPRAAATVLLEKGGLLGRSRGGAAGVAFVARRAARAQAGARDRLAPIGNTVWHLRGTFDNLRERLLPAPEIRETAAFWAERGRAWGTTGFRFRRAFHGYCRVRGTRRHAEALQRFEGELSEVQQREGVAGLKRALANLRGESPARGQPHRASGP
jgi:hypothetical protein